METIFKSLLLIVFGILLILALSLVFAFPLKWTWNGVMPYLFGFKEIGVVQAFCLSFVAGCLVKPSFSSSKE